MKRKRSGFTGIARGKKEVPAGVREDVSDVLERLAVRRRLDSPEEAVIFSLFATTAALEELCARLLAPYPVFQELGMFTRLEGLHFLFILYDVTTEERQARALLRLTQKQIGAIMKVFGHGNETSIPNALKNTFEPYLDLEAEARGLRLNDRGLELAEEISGRYYALMEKLFALGEDMEDVAPAARLLRRLRDNAALIGRELGADGGVQGA